MTQTTSLMVLGWWLALASIGTLLFFGIDKWQATRGSERRISEFSLLLMSAVGGWPGGLLAIVFFRHKSAKVSFLVKFFVALIVYVFLVGAGLKFSGKL